MSDAPVPSVLDAAREYLRRGWRVVPIPYKQKRPVLDAWEQLQLGEADLAEYFDQPANIGLILGEPSGGLVDVDLDCAEARAIAGDYLPPTPAKTGRAGAPNSHWWYYADGTGTKQHREPGTRKMIVELRNTGAQTVVGPSLHPSGERYDVLAGEPAIVPGPMLAACVEALARRVIEIRGTDSSKEPVRNESPRHVVNSHRSLGPADVERRALAYLDRMDPAISGQGGHSATYAAATALVHGFQLSPDRALAILLEHYNPRCEPPWSERELRHKVDDAASRSHERPYGWLLADHALDDPAVDLSAIVTQVRAVAGAPPARPASDPSVPVLEYPDPGPIPRELLRVPGFISEVMDYCLETAPYPSQALAFCGALALQAFLAGRKVRDQADNRTNLYLLGLAHSAAGKDWPRKINTRILHQVGLAASLGDQFASGEGLEDALLSKPCMLFQTDEIDGMLQSINRARDARYESIMRSLLTIYSSANSVVVRRTKANHEAGAVIDR